MIFSNYLTSFIVLGGLSILKNLTFITIFRNSSPHIEKPIGIKGKNREENMRRFNH